MICTVKTIHLLIPRMCFVWRPWWSINPATNLKWSIFSSVAQKNKNLPQRHQKAGLSSHCKKRSNLGFREWMFLNKTVGESTCLLGLGKNLFWNAQNLFFYASLMSYSWVMRVQNFNLRVDFQKLWNIEKEMDRLYPNILTQTVLDPLGLSMQHWNAGIATSGIASNGKRYISVHCS